MDAIQVAREWALRSPHVIALALVGSRARGEATPASDLDFVALTEDIDAAIIEARSSLPWEFMERREWGPLLELRFREDGGLEVDPGIAPATWADTDPVDAGTARVVRDGIRVLDDPRSLLAGLIQAAGGR